MHLSFLVWEMIVATRKSVLALRNRYRATHKKPEGVVKKKIKAVRSFLLSEDVGLRWAVIDTETRPVKDRTKGE